MKPNKTQTSNTMDRRDFLKTTGAGMAALSFPVPLGTLGTTQKRAAGETPVLVCLYLRGGMDALNCIIPYKDKRYYEIRPTISIAPCSAQPRVSASVTGTQSSSPPGPPPAWRRAAWCRARVRLS